MDAPVQLAREGHESRASRAREPGRSRSFADREPCQPTVQRVGDSVFCNFVISSLKFALLHQDALDRAYDALHEVCLWAELGCQSKWGSRQLHLGVYFDIACVHNIAHARPAKTWTLSKLCHNVKNVDSE